MASAPAEQLYARAITLKEGMARESPSDADARRSLAQSYNNRATFWQTGRDRTRAADDFGKSITELEVLRKDPGKRR